jgi:hypothetical protein
VRDTVRGWWGRSPLALAWVAIGLWVLAYAVLKVVQPDGMDIDSAEQVYFAQSWQMGYGMRQPPLYTWLILALKPAGAAWEATLECARYLVLLWWLGGVQALARASGACAPVQARVLLAHLGLMLVMWRVHDSLTHTVLAAALVTWGSVAVVKALCQPRWWPVAGVLAALACLAKLNAALWCASSLLSACFVLWQMGRTTQAAASPLFRRHAAWMLAALGLSLAMLAPFAQWWLGQRAGPLVLAQHIVAADAHVPWWRPGVDLLGSSIEYLMLVPLLLAVLAWSLRRHGGPLRALPLAGRWMRWQSVGGVLLLLVMTTLMQGSHFTPRWLWPVVPGLTVWLTMRALDRAELLDQRWQRLVDGLLWAGVVLALALAALRWWEPARTAQHCRNCWTDRPAELLSADLHARYGTGLRLITGDDHLAGILVAADGRDLSWTAASPDLPPPAGFAAARGPCVAVWMDTDRPRAAPAELQAMMGPEQGLPPATREAWPMARAPERVLWLQSRLLSPQLCDKAPR